MYFTADFHCSGSWDSLSVIIFYSQAMMMSTLLSSFIFIIGLRLWLFVKHLHLGRQLSELFVWHWQSLRPCMAIHFHCHYQSGKNCRQDLIFLQFPSTWILVTVFHISLNIGLKHWQHLLKMKDRNLPIFASMCVIHFELSTFRPIWDISTPVLTIQHSVCINREQ